MVQAVRILNDFHGVLSDHSALGQHLEIDQQALSLPVGILDIDIRQGNACLELLILVLPFQLHILGEWELAGPGYELLLLSQIKQAEVDIALKYALVANQFGLDNLQIRLVRIELLHRRAAGWQFRVNYVTLHL